MEISEQVLAAFQAEHKEQLQGLRSILGALGERSAPPGDPRWDEAFRMAHTLKGGARVCALSELEQLSHRMESVFASIRSGNTDFHKGVADAVFLALDAIEDWMAALAEHAAPPQPTQALAAIEALLAKNTAPRSPSIAPPVTGAGVEPARPPIAAPASGAAPSPAPSPDSDTVRVRVSDLDAILRSADEIVTQAARSENLAPEIAALHRSVSALISECESVRSSNGAELRRLASTPELAPLARHLDSVIQHARRLAKDTQRLRASQQVAAWSRGRGADTLRRDAARARMIAADNVLTGLGPMVRRLAGELGKRLDFHATGLDTVADRRVLQAMKDPLMHVLRNAVVHGIEAPEERAARGKSQEGRITLSLRANGAMLELVVEDDGRGVDFAGVAAEARRRGHDAAPATDEAALARLLFQPGFSTTREVTELAGRGIGLSVVHVAAARLQGHVELRSKLGAGATFVIVIPLSVSAQRLLLVTAGDQTFAIPTHAIDHLQRIEPKQVGRLEGRPIVTINDVPLPMIPLRERLGIEAAPVASGALLAIAVVRSGNDRVALQVDAFLTERESLIRELDAPAASVRGFTGAALLDDASIALVLDPGHFTDDHAAPVAQPTAAKPVRPANRAPRILVVDDSFTTRTLEKSILEANGFDVRIAVDGVQALLVLRSEPIDVVIADVEMPRMDGLAMLKEVKADPRLAHVPVILVTSLDRREDQEKGLSLGAGAYIVKRKFDHHDLLATISKFL